MCRAGGPRCDSKWSPIKQDKDNARRRLRRAENNLAKKQQELSKNKDSNSTEEIELLQKKIEQEKSTLEHVEQQAHNEDMAIQRFVELQGEFGKEYVDLAIHSFKSHIEPGDEIHIDGRTRMVIVKKDHVLKFPVNGEGYLQGSHEKHVYEEYKANPNGKYVIPVTWIEMCKDSNGFGYSKHEKVEPVFLSYSDPDSPEWLGFVDGGQAGRTIDGRIVAYDL